MKYKRAVINNQAVGYIRVSTDRQADCGVSLESQQERLEAYCKMQGLELTSTIREEGVSASIALSSRPGGSQLLAAIRNGSQHVVALKLDRLFRDAEDALRVTKEWDRQGVTLHLIDFGGSSLNTSSATGRVMLTMLAAFGEFERNLISERTTAALDHMKNHMQVYNHVPYGFTRQGDQLIPDPAEGAIVQRIKTYRASRLTLQRIADLLNNDGVPTKQGGGRWFASTISNVLNSTMHESV